MDNNVEIQKEEFSKKKKNKVYIPIMASIIAILILAGISFAYYSASIDKINETKTDVSTDI